MAAGLFEQYNDMTLQEVMISINKNYYELIAALNIRADEQADYIKRSQLSEASLTYLLQYDKLFDKVQKYIEQRKLSFMPYIDELVEKDKSNHDCSNCSGRCAMQHTSMLIDFTLSLQNIKKAIYEMTAVMLKTYWSNNKGLGELHKYVMLLESTLNELFRIEEEHLLPKIKVVQKNIHAHS